MGEEGLSEHSGSAGPRRGLGDEEACKCLEAENP